MGQDRLRIGLLLDDLCTAAWSYKLIEDIKNSHFAEIVLVVLNNIPRRRSASHLTTRNDRTRGLQYSLVRELLTIMYKRAFERNVRVPDVDEERDSSSLLKGIPVIQVVPTEKNGEYLFPEEVVGKIKGYSIDVFVRCGFRFLQGDVLNSAKYGIWSIHTGAHVPEGKETSGFLETLENWPEIDSTLRIQMGHWDKSRILYKSFSCPDHLSAKDNRSNCLWKSLSFVTRRMEQLYRKGGDEFFRELDSFDMHPDFCSRRLYAHPTNTLLAKLIFLNILRKIRIILHERLFHEQWFLMFDLSSEFSSCLCGYRKMVPPKDRLWADPHIIYRDGRYYIFIEECLFKSGKGHISVIVMDKNGEYQEPVKVLEKSHHLSYPFVFKHEGEHYMIPETASSSAIELYKCVDFPVKWEWQMNLMEDVKARDATVLYHDGKWWMFANLVEREGAPAWDELFLFYSTDLLTNEWTPHPQNPVISDCKSARPAGKVFEKDGRLYRPSQNCSGRYGRGFNISHIELLNEHDYREKIVSSVTPDWDKSILATHTFNRVRSLHIIDALANRWK